VASLQTFHDHVKELRRRILWCVLAIGLSASLAYTFRLPLTRFMQHPIGTTLYYNSPAGSFNFILKLSMLIGMFIALPVIVYNLLRFIEPALPVKISRRTMLTVMSASLVLALGGMAFSYYYLLPLSLKFFSGYATAQIKPLISAGEYLSFLMGHLITFALMFQIPLVVLFINWIKPIKPGKFLRYQRHVIVAAFGLAVILPFTYDPISQFIVAIPIVVLYYLSIILLWFANRKRYHPEVVAAKQPISPSVHPDTGYVPPISLPMPVARAQRGALAMDGFVPKPAHNFSQPTVKVSTAPSIKSMAESEPPVRLKRAYKPARRLSIDGLSRGFSPQH
jgi:sec-independent protein translocase protein TatC